MLSGSRSPAEDTVSARSRPQERSSSEQAAGLELAARIEPFDSFWEGPEDVEKGYRSFFEFYRRNYLRHLPPDRDARILVVSCGPGYLVHTLARHGYRNVVGIDSDRSKAEHGRRRGLDCRVERAFPFVARIRGELDVVFCEQELNHLTKEEMLVFLELCREALAPGGRLIVHGLNGANPITGAEALAQNFDHYNTFTEYTLRQVLEHVGFERVQVFPLNLYVFYWNPLNWVAWAAAGALHLFFRAAFLLYGKSARIFTKKLAAAGVKPA